mmetsp:Transcript_22255/g.57016  ORF Transcript_22255/g.57016 Transcript_22255/m.57016 type:complete len:195 (+) Transcript_22255:150-734(+)|eukprot:jgi/Tetstr1/420853/TSEL_011926.t1
MAPKPRPITVVHNFGGRRCTGIPVSVQDWGLWDCDPTKTGAPTQKHAFGKEFPWVFDKEEKAYVLEGEATLTPDDPALHGAAVRIVPKDMVTFPKGWRGRWEVHSFLRKHYAFFDGKGLRVDEASDSEDDGEAGEAGQPEVKKSAPAASAAKGKAGKASPTAKGGGAKGAGQRGGKAKAAKEPASSPAAKKRKV